MEKKDFLSLGLSNWLVNQVAAVGYKTPTPVQENCIPVILEEWEGFNERLLKHRESFSGRDCLGCAKTGSGKTAAFALPILHRLSEDPYGVFALVLTPTRELAYQIADQFRVFGSHIGLKDVVIVGGTDMMKQGLALSRKPHIVIATPGRLADHIQNTDTVSFKGIRFLVLDEADRLLEPSFESDLEAIFSALPAKRQTLLFSATLTDSLERLKELASEKPFFWQAPAEVVTVQELEQKYLLMPAKVKDCYLVHLLERLLEGESKSVILFTQTCRSCHVYALLLREMDLPCVALHSLMSQRRRMASLAKFRSGRVKILVATDVASRGLDIPVVSAVVNGNVPASSKDYIHRVGRTARAGYAGMSVTLVTQYDIERVKNIESHTKCRMEEYGMPEEETLEDLDRISITKREIELRVKQSGFGEQRKINMKKRKLIEQKLRMGRKSSKTTTCDSSQINIDKND